jgi:Amino acid transporters
MVFFLMSHLKQHIGLWQGTGLLVSTLLGSGVFIVPAMTASLAGRWSLLAWALMGILILPIVFTFASLGKRYPDAGGTAFYVEQAFGERAADAISWLFLSVILIGPPVVIITATGYLCQTFGLPQSQQGFWQLMLLGSMLLLNLLNRKTATWIQSFISFGICTTLLLVIGLYLYAHPVSLPPTPFSLPTLAQATALIFWCFVGVEAIAHLSGEFHHPERDFPRVVMLGVVIALILYLCLSTVLLSSGFYGNEAQNLTSVIQLMSSLTGHAGHLLVGLFGLMTCYIGVNTYITSFSRLFYSMAERGQIHGWAGKLNRFGAPAMGLYFTCGLIAITLVMRLCVHLPLDGLIGYSNGVFVLIYLAASLSGLKLLTGRGRWLAIIATGVCLLVAASLALHTLYALAVLAACMLHKRQVHNL